MQRLMVFLIVLLVGAGFLATEIFYVVNERAQAIQLQFGEAKRVATEPGLYMKTPFIERVEYVEKRLLVLDAPPQEVIVAGNRRFVVDAFMRFRITDPLEYYRTLRTRAQADARLAGILDTALREVLAVQDLEKFLSDERVTVMNNIRDLVRARIAEFGLDVVDVRIKRADLPPQNSEAIYARMVQERRREANEFRAQGRELANRIEAQADREVQVILAEARRESEKIRGDGDAERNRIFAEAFGKDPDFFAFYRSMLAYREALGESGTTLVLSPKSQFFRFFEDQEGR